VWGLVINEAILSGLPVICSKYAGCAEEIVPREYVFDPLNPDEFVGLLRKAIVGEIECTSQSQLMTATQVGDIILSDVVDVVCADRKLAARAAAGEK
jgi:glycosyltransferase involved in cell wall biosynthesis